MPGQTLNTYININARAGNGFSQVGAALTELGGLINGLSQELIHFGEDSINVYRDYEKSMSDAEVALSTTYGRGTKELSTVMSQLDTAATNWAATTIFHTNDVGNAISEAAHAGWDYEQIMSGIPAAMQLAQAGSIDLSEAVNYIVKSTSAAGISFDEMGSFIDMWAFAANSSASSIDEFGQAMLRMGSTMRFAANPEELFTLIAVTANAGSVGSEAGTLIRNSMIRLVAPTEKAEKAMAELGATTLETAGLMDDEELAAANARLAAEGFSAYDSEGNLKNILDIYRELYLSLGQVAGGFDNIEKNEDAIAILSAIFPTRTITEALTLLRGAAEGYDGLYAAMRGGDAEGYGEYAAATMMDTLDGKIETFESKIERLEQLVGQRLSGQVEDAAEFIGDIVDSISNLDEAKFNALVAGLEGIAFAGPALLGLGALTSLIGALATPIGAAAAGMVVLVGGLSALAAYNESLYKDNFGNLELDTAGLQTYIQSLGNEFEAAYEQVNLFNTALQTAIDTYTGASGDLKSSLISMMLEGTEITEGSPEYQQLVGMGEQIALALQAGISSNYASTMEGVTQTFGGNPDEIDNGIWSQIILVLNAGMEAELENAASIGQRLREAMLSAFSDGHLTADEVANIQSIIDEGNTLLAQQQNREHYIERQRILRKAQTLGLDAISEASEMVEEQRNAEWETLMDQQAADYYDVGYWYDQAIANGWMIPDADGMGGEHAATQADKDAALAELERQQEAERYRWTADYNDYVMGLWQEGITSSDLAGSWEALEQLGRDFREAGGIVTQEAANRYAESTSASDSAQAQRYLQDMVDALGGRDQLQGYADYLEGIGDLEKAAHFQNLVDMYDAMGGEVTTAAPTVGMVGPGDYSDVSGSYEQIAALLNGAYGEGVMKPEDLANYMQEQRSMGMEPDWMLYLGDELYSQFNAVAQQNGMTISDLIANLGLVSSATNTEPEELQVGHETTMYPDRDRYGHEVEMTPRETGHEITMSPREELGTHEIELTPRLDQGELDGEINGENHELTLTPRVNEGDVNATVGGLQQSLPLLLTPYVQGTNPVSSLQEQGVSVQVDGDTQNLEASIDGFDGQTLMEYISGDATNLSLTITSQDGKTLVENVTGNTTDLANAIRAYNGQTVTVNIRGNRMFAKGGRATEASTFGEAGPEWAIPEKHDDNTAALLNATRQASGFTWSELIHRTGGLNANAENVNTTIVYSPTVYAQNAEGVDRALQDDKKRFARWFSERKEREEMEVYT